MADSRGTTEYLAVVRTTSASSSQKVRYIANNIKHAIDKLCAICMVTSTLELYEFEVMEILFDETDTEHKRPTGYRPAASKLGAKVRNSSGTIPVVSPAPPRVEPKKEAMDRVNNSNANVSKKPDAPTRSETSYTPYKLKVDA